MITEEMVSKMITKHVGGYPDIIQFLKDSGRESDVERSMNRCNSTGEFASEVQQIIRTVSIHLPTTDSPKEWAQACAFWDPNPPEEDDDSE